MIVTNPSGEKQVVVQLGEHEDDIIKQMAILALENNGMVIARAAKSLGLKRSCLSMRLKNWGFYADTEVETVQTECLS